MEKIEVNIFVQENGKSPYEIWIDSLDKKTEARISSRINRIYEGHFGDHKLLQDGIWELRFNFGPGYRIYFGKKANSIIILLVGGDKDSQKKRHSKSKRILV